MMTSEYFNSLEPLYWQHTISYDNYLVGVKYDKLHTLDLLREFGGSESLSYLIDHHVLIQVKKTHVNQPQYQRVELTLYVTAWVEPKHATYYNLRLSNNNEYGYG